MQISNDSVLALLEILSYANESAARLISSARPASSVAQALWAKFPVPEYVIDDEKCSIYHVDRSTMERGACYPGNVYVVRTGDLHKIGFSQNGVKDRLAAARREYGIDVEITRIIRTACGRGLERYLHSKFAEKRIYSEFFYLDPSDLTLIASIAFFNGAMVQHYDPRSSSWEYAPIKIIRTRKRLSAPEMNANFLRNAINCWLDKTL